ncbi:MAG: LPP20 family lipoprotein [Gammaproteobacteria bacterium]
MKLLLTIIFSATVWLLGGCATQPTQSAQPDWVVGESAKYKSAQYLIGRGQASTMEEAKDRARADLAKIFQVAVAVDSEDVQSFKSDAAGGAGQYAGESSRRITTRTDQIVRGIQIAEIWQDPVSKNQHVLAILPRLQAAAALRQQINQLDDATQGSVDQSNKNSDLFIKIAAASKAVASQLEREGLQKALQVVDITGRGLESKFNSGRLKADMDDLLKRVRVAPRVLEGSVPGLDEVVAGALSQAGFMIDTGEKPDFLLKASLQLTDLGLKQGWYWQRGNLEVSMSEAATGRVLGTQRWPIKGSATDKESAIRRALDEADAVLKKELGATIIGMATSK